MSVDLEEDLMLKKCGGELHKRKERPAEARLVRLGAYVTPAQHTSFLAQARY